MGFPESTSKKKPPSSVSYPRQQMTPLSQPYYPQQQQQLPAQQVQSIKDYQDAHGNQARSEYLPAPGEKPKAPSPQSFSPKPPSLIPSPSDYSGSAPRSEYIPEKPGSAPASPDQSQKKSPDLSPQTPPTPADQIAQSPVVKPKKKKVWNFNGTD
ncbi:unnamed protein product, partial [Mesorhabditis spiculigera]